MYNKTSLYNQLIEHEVHYGNKVLKPHKSMLPYLIKNKKGDESINLNLTRLSLKQVSTVLTTFFDSISEKKEAVVFIGHPYNKVMDKIIEYAALSCGQKFLPFSLNKLNHAKLHNELKELNPNFIIVFSVAACKTVLKECENLMIPSIGVCNTQSDIESVTYAIPGNDNSYKSIYFYCNFLRLVIEKSVQKNFQI